MPKIGYDKLMYVVCVEWGFCGCVKHGEPLHVDMFIPSAGTVTAGQFVEWVFLADNVNPNSELERWQRQKTAIHAAFVDCMGADVVDAAQLQWSSVREQPTTLDDKYRGQLT